VGLVISHEDLLVRLNKHTAKTFDGHWLWIGHCNVAGYGVIKIEGVEYKVGRLSAYLFHNLDLDSDLKANHKDECPHKGCWNPNHIYVGSQSDNMSDMIRATNEKPLFPCGHQRIDSNIEIVRDYRNAAPSRRCRLCQRKREKVYRDKRKNKCTTT